MFCEVCNGFHALEGQVPALERGAGDSSLEPGPSQVAQPPTYAPGARVSGEPQTSGYGMGLSPSHGTGRVAAGVSEITSFLPSSYCLSPKDQEVPGAFYVEMGREGVSRSSLGQKGSLGTTLLSAFPFTVTLRPWRWQPPECSINVTLISWWYQQNA